MQISKKTTTVIYNQAEKKKPPNIYRYLTQSKPITGKAEKRYRLPAFVSQMQKMQKPAMSKKHLHHNRGHFTKNITTTTVNKS